MSEYFAAADLSGLPPEGLAVVGFSGGADSMALAHWLSGKLPRERLVLAHVNHLLRGEEAERDQGGGPGLRPKAGGALRPAPGGCGGPGPGKGPGPGGVRPPGAVRLLPQPGKRGERQGADRPQRPGQRRDRAAPPGPGNRAFRPVRHPSQAGEGVAALPVRPAGGDRGLLPGDGPALL